ncbi:MAG: hypothetical protein JWP32_2299 [Schumannella sp.]|nr:hypothetical protein [Schumannella sp.]
MTANRIWIVAAALGIVGIVALGWLLGISPKLAEADAAVASQVSVDQQNADQEAVLVVLRDQYEHLDDLKKQVKDLRLEVPDRPEVEGFIEYATGVAASSGVVISTISALEPTLYGGTPAEVAPPAEAPAADGEASSAPTGDAATPTTGGDASSIGTSDGESTPAGPAELFTVSITLAVQGSPEQVMAFSRLLQDGKRIFLPTQVTFTSGSQGVLGGTVAGYVFVLGSPMSAGPKPVG